MGRWPRKEMPAGIWLSIDRHRHGTYNKLYLLCNLMHRSEKTMLKNNIEVDVKVKCIEAGMT